MPTLPKLPDFTTETFTRKGKTLKKRIYSNSSPIGQLITEIKKKELELARLTNEIEALKEQVFIPAQRFNLARVENKAGFGLDRKSKTKWSYKPETQKKIVEFNRSLHEERVSGKALGKTRFYLS
jgi:hypothetical protein